MSKRIEIAANARRWLAGHGIALVVRTSPRHGCCGGLAGVPVAEAGPPEDTRDYRHERIEEIDVYIDPGLDGAGTLTISLQGFWACDACSSRARS